VNAFYASTRLSKETVSLRNAAETARLIARAAARNTTSIGTHYVENNNEEEMEAVPLAEAGGGMVQGQ
jgi:aspartate oxidase